MTQGWTITSLKSALEGAFDEDEATLSELQGGAALQVRFPDHGDLEVTVTVAGEQLLASTLLWPRASQAAPTNFEEHALRIHKFLPLSTFGITTVDGEDWYELFGALSANATLEDVLMELQRLAQNAVDVAEANAAA